MLQTCVEFVYSALFLLLSVQGTLLTYAILVISYIDALESSAKVKPGEVGPSAAERPDLSLFAIGFLGLAQPSDLATVNILITAGHRISLEPNEFSTHARSCVFD